MKHQAARAFPDLGDIPDADLLSGLHGVFVGEWIEASREPEHTGNYLVALTRMVEPVIGMYLKGAGWTLEFTDHIGLEDWISHWMPLPETPEGK